MLCDSRATGQNRQGVLRTLHDPGADFAFDSIEALYPLLAAGGRHAFHESTRLSSMSKSSLHTRTIRCTHLYRGNSRNRNIPTASAMHGSLNRRTTTARACFPVKLNAVPVHRSAGDPGILQTFEPERGTHGPRCGSGPGSSRRAGTCLQGVAHVLSTNPRFCSTKLRARSPEKLDGLGPTSL